MKERMRYILIISILHTVAFIPLRLLYGFSNGIYLLLYYLTSYRKKTVRENLSHSFPEKSRKELQKIEKRFYRHLCDCIVESIKLLHISDREIDRRIKVENAYLIEELAADNRPIIVFLGHYGNWEWVQAVTRHYKRPAINGEIYRPLHDEAMNKVMQKIRSRFDTLMLRQKQAFRTLLKMRREGKQCLIGFIADQRPNSKSLNHWTTFLNQDTAYSVGGDEIGRRIDAHFLYLEVTKEKRGHYLMSFKTIVPDCPEAPYPYTLQFMKMLENTIRKAPEYWLWSHKRWRIRRTAANATPDKNKHLNHI